MFRRSVLAKSEKQEYGNNNIKISCSKVKQSSKGSGEKRSKDKRHRKDIIAAKRELQKIKESIDAARDKLNRMASQGERLELTDEILKVSRQLDVLIQDYQRKSDEVQKMTEF